MSEEIELTRVRLKNWHQIDLSQMKRCIDSKKIQTETLIRRIQKLRSRHPLLFSHKDTDKEVGVREEQLELTSRWKGNLGRDGSPEAMERSKKITGVMNKKGCKAAHRKKRRC